MKIMIMSCKQGEEVEQLWVLVMESEKFNIHFIENMHLKTLMRFQLTSLTQLEGDGKQWKQSQFEVQAHLNIKDDKILRMYVHESLGYCIHNDNVIFYSHIMQVMAHTNINLQDVDV